MIELLLGPETQAMAVQAVDTLGPDSLVAIIDVMDDRRRLGASRITLSNPPGFFEAYATYGPDVVTDVCIGILSRHGSEGFFAELVNGGAEETRRVAIDAWRVYGDMLLNHPNELTSQGN